MLWLPMQPGYSHVILAMCGHVFESSLVMCLSQVQQISGFVRLWPSCKVTCFAFVR